MPDHVTGAEPSPRGRQVLLIGAGPMALAYYKVLVGLNVEPIVLGRGAQSAERFAAATGVTPGTGSLSDQLERLGKLPDFVISAVSIADLAPVAETLLARNARHLLVEKPGAIHAEEAMALAALDTHGVIRVAYNRRFLASTLKAQELIALDGGVVSLAFEFGEIGDELATTAHPDIVTRNWIFANSTHCIDLAFYLAGVPGPIPFEALSCAATAGHLPRHPDAAIFVGSGQLPSGALFVYHANWLAGAGWRIEATTAKRRLFLQPLETLRVQERGSFRQAAIDVTDAIEQQYKPGLYRMVERFLTAPSDPAFLTMRDQAERMRFVEQMLRPARRG